MVFLADEVSECFCHFELIIELLDNRGIFVVQVSGVVFWILASDFESYWDVFLLFHDSCTNSIVRNSIFVCKFFFCVDF